MTTTLAPTTPVEQIEALRVLLSNEAVLKAPEGQPFVLSSGETSLLYFDLKKVILAPEAILTIGGIVRDEARARGAGAVGGLAAGAIPIAMAAVAVEAMHGGTALRSFYVRSETKTHGTRESVYQAFSPDGVPAGVSPGGRVIVVDDVLTTGRSIGDAMDEVLARGAEVAAILVLIDRRAGGAATLREKYGVPVIAVFRVDEQGDLTFCRDEIDG